MEENEEVEVVYSLDYIWQLVLLLVLGAIIGGTCTAGALMGRMQSLAERRAVINGDVAITSNRQEPVSISNVDINANGAEYGLKIVTH